MSNANPRRWSGPALNADGSYLVTLEPAEIGQLAKKLPERFTAPRDEASSDLYRGEATASLSDLAKRIREQVTAGCGLAILTGKGLDTLTDGQLTFMLYGLSLVLGRPMAQNPAGDRIVSVRDEHPADPQARGYRTNKDLLMHTDAADVAGLLCLNQGSVGGGNAFASAEMVHDVLTDEAPELLHEYYQLWEWDLRGLHREGARPTLSSPIFSFYAGRLSCRYASLLLRQGAARAGGELSAAQVAALDRFEEVARRPQLQVTRTLGRGESMWFDNYGILHGREAFADEAASGRVRHLLRSWVWLHDGPLLAPSFASPREVY
ncbi:TauD/TfdA family dioxygenase [Dactylosporangium sp. CA-092794]|uniref:TauD/TfdA family dioxygenase n=1 Tax=Dactylosporangium sp. CA-092794 TaxID=3239929 RepID=UPI003D8C9DD1